MKALMERLSKIKNPSGKEPESLVSLEARYELLRGPRPDISLDELNVRFRELEGEHDNKSMENVACELRTTSGAGTSTDAIDLNDISELSDCNDGDDFMDFINESLSLTRTDQTRSAQYEQSDAPSIDESRLRAAEKISEKIEGDIAQCDRMSCLEDFLNDNPVPSVFLADEGAAVSGKLRVPQKDKTELDMLMEQTRDECRLLGPHAGTVATRGVLFEDDDYNDQVRQLVMAAQDASYLEKKYGVEGARNNAGNRITKAGITTNEDGESNNDSVESRSYGSNISDDSSLDDSD